MVRVRHLEFCAAMLVNGVHAFKHPFVVAHKIIKGEERLHLRIKRIRIKRKWVGVSACQGAERRENLGCIH